MIATTQVAPARVVAARRAIWRTNDVGAAAAGEGGQSTASSVRTRATMGGLG